MPWVNYFTVYIAACTGEILHADFSLQLEHPAFLFLCSDHYDIKTRIFCASVFHITCHIKAVYAHTLFIYIQVKEIFYNLERVYRDCINMTRDKTIKDIQ